MRRLLALLLLCLLPTQVFAAGTLVYQGGVVTGGGGDVTGPAVSVDNGIVRYDGTTGKLVQSYTSGTPTCDDTGICTFVANPIITNTAPSLILTDTTASAKSLTIAVDADLAQWRESAGASLSGLVYDLANNRLGIGTTPDKTFMVQSAKPNELIASIINTAGNGWGPAFGTAATAEPFYAMNVLIATTTAAVSVRADGKVGLMTTAPASLLDLRAGDLTMSGANGQQWVQGYKTELTTIAAAATTTTTITIPANAILEAVLMRVTTVIPTAATMVVTATTTGTILQQGASISVAAGTTDIGTRANGTNYGGVAAQTITITPNATPIDNTGRVRFDIYYRVPTVATS